MIGTLDISLNAKSPNLPLFPLRSFVNSPSSLRIANVPRRVGNWCIDSVYIVAVYPDGTIKTASCVLVGGVWVGTIDGTPISGKSENGYTIFADGTDEKKNAVTGYVLGKGDIEILEADGSLSPDAARYYVKLLSAEAEEPREGDLYPTAGGYAIWQGGAAHTLGTPLEQISAIVDSAVSSKADLSALDDYAKIDGLSAKADLSALDEKADLSALPSKTSQLTNDSGFITSAQVEPEGAKAGYAKNSYWAMLVPEMNTVGGEPNTANFFSVKPSDNEKGSAATVTIQTYDSWFLSYYNGTTFDPPIELKWGYCTEVYIITNGRKRKKTINSNAWFAQVGDEHNYVIKAVEGPNYYVPVDSMIIDNTEHPVTYDYWKNQIETIDGQSGVMTCTRISYAPLHPYYELAYRDEVSSKADLSALDVKADLSALNGKQDKLTNTQISAINAEADERQTIVEYDNIQTMRYDIYGTITIDDIRVQGSNILGVKLGRGVTSIGTETFMNSPQLLVIKIPDTVERIQTNAFTTSNLPVVDIPDSVTTIDDYAFSGSYIQSITLGSGVESIGQGAFDNCSYLTSLVFEGKTLEEVEEMENYPWGISDTSIIRTFNVASQEWVLEQLAALTQQ